jgi:hypothetical protein
MPGNSFRIKARAIVFNAQFDPIRHHIQFHHHALRLGVLRDVMERLLNCTVQSNLDTRQSGCPSGTPRSRLRTRLRLVASISATDQEGAVFQRHGAKIEH